MPSLEGLLKKREGSRLDVYPDKLGILTVGIGHRVVANDKLKLHDLIDEKQVSVYFKKDSAKALSAARSQAAKAGIKDTQFITYLASVNFQLGRRWHIKFTKAWRCILQKNYEDAAAEVKNSKWYSQTPRRAKDFHQALLRLAGKVDKDDDEEKPVSKRR